MSKLRVSEEVIQELKRIGEAHSGLLFPEDIVRAAESKSSILHSRFEWDDSKAAHDHRLWQARYLINISVEYIDPGNQEKPSRVFVSLSSDREHGGYRTLVSVMGDREKREQLFADALGAMENFQRKYNELKELESVFASMRTVKKRLTRKAVAA